MIREEKNMTDEEVAVATEINSRVCHLYPEEHLAYERCVAKKTLRAAVGLWGWKPKIEENKHD